MNFGVREKVAEVFSDLGDYLSEIRGRRIQDRESALFGNFMYWLDRFSKNAVPRLNEQLSDKVVESLKEYDPFSDNPPREDFVEGVCFVGAEICYGLSYLIGERDK